MKGKKTGGRTKGAQNKTTAAIKQTITDVITTYEASGQLSKDFLSLEPYQRLTISERLIQYVVPKQQAISADIELSVAEKTVADKLNTLNDEYTD